MKQKNKITFEIRKQIHNLSMSLPQVPFFIEGKNGMVPQRIATGKRVSARELPDEEIKRIGVSLSGMYVQRGQVTRMMNHKVNLNKAYEQDGDAGIVAYSAYVNKVAEMIENLRNPKIVAEPVAEGEVNVPFVQEEGAIESQPETTITTSENN